MEVKVDKASADALQKALSKALSEGRTKALFYKIGMELSEKAKRNCESRGSGVFWTEIKDSIGFTESESGVEVGSTDWRSPHVQFGGPIEAPGKGPRSKGKAALTVPVSSLSKGKKVSDFDRKKIVKIGNVLFLKVGKDEPMIKLFVLCKKTKPQAPRPFLPWGDEVEEIAGESAGLWMKEGLAQ